MSTLRLHAITLVASNKLSDAAELLNEALRENPLDFEAAVLLADVCFRAKKYDSVYHLTNQVIKGSSDSAILSKAWELQGRTDAQTAAGFPMALKAFKRSIDAQPNSPDALARYYAMQEKMGDYEQALSNLDMELERFPTHSGLLLTAAKCKRRMKRFEEALADLEIALTQDNSHDVERQLLYLLAEILDRTSQYSAAFVAFEAANNLVLNQDKRRRQISMLYLQSAKNNLKYLEQQSQFDWNLNTPESLETGAPIFMIGFPRTGSTLLEQVLHSHRDFFTVEERPIIQTLVNTVFTKDQQTNYPASIAELEQQDIDKLREVYWNTINEFIPSDKRHLRIIDKMPLNTTHIGLLHLLFPNAQVIYTMRHPLDVCLSCYMQNFVDNAAMVNFLDLGVTVDLYKAVSGLWQEYTRLLDINHISIKYEDLVKDFDGTTKRLLDFLGSEPDDNIRDFHKSATERKSVRSASYHQVSEKLSLDAIGRWKNYETELADYIPLLEKHISQQGYEI